LLGKDLEQSESRKLFTLLIRNRLPFETVVQILALLQKKGEAVTELTGLVKAARRIQKRLKFKPVHANLCDGCGTGGDGKQTINISTAASLVAAAAGAYVAKHGNYSITSRAGSSDLMKALRVRIQAPSHAMLRSLKQIGFGYFHAPAYTKAFRYAAPARQALARQKMKTIFNLSGPLLNPLHVKRQVIGVFHYRYIPLLIKTLKLLGCRHALVVSGQDGTDEITTHQITYTAELKKSQIKYGRFQPKQWLLRRSQTKDLKGGGALFNAKKTLRILNGTDRSACTDVVLANAGAMLYVAGISPSIRAGIQKAAVILKTGKALMVLNQLRRLSQ